MPQTAIKLLVVDDESAIRRLLRRCFEDAGFDVEEAGSGDELFHQLKQHDISLITLDIGLGSRDGLDLARVIRQEYDIPIVMVTGKGDLIDTVVGLEVGADDYITKPFELREVLARVRAVLRRYETQSPTTASFTKSTVASGQHDVSAQIAADDPQTPPESAGNRFQFNQWILDTASRELRSPENTLCELTTAQYELLEILVTHSRQVLSRDQIMDHLRGSDWTPTDRTIDNQISRLRQRLKSANSDVQLIKTIRGVGYMFNATVEKV